MSIASRQGLCGEKRLLIAESEWTKIEKEQEKTSGTKAEKELEIVDKAKLENDEL